ncbi:MAG TPA: hypothetical protein DD405_07440, partial [Desulfobacteraceae bacterium]|nr:hypothetical protein [Desulfobacteraceae bacterium]
GAEIIDLEIVHELTRYANPIIRKEAKHLLNFQQNPVSKEKNMESALSTSEIILHLKKIDIFKKLSVNELAEIATITKKVVYPPGKIVFNEGDIAETIYLIIEGELSVFKNEIEMMGKLVSGDSFGSMALLLDDVRLLTARTETASQLLVIHKQDFEEIVREYPQIALEISKVIAENFQRLVEKVAGMECTVGDSVIK